MIPKKDVTCPEIEFGFEPSLLSSGRNKSEFISVWCDPSLIIKVTKQVVKWISDPLGIQTGIVLTSRKVQGIITSVFPVPRFFGYRNHKNFRNLFRVFALLIRPKSFCDFDIDGIWIGKPFIIWNELRCEKGGIKGITSVLMQSFGVEFSICIN